jgi:hypothetical protein
MRKLIVPLMFLSVSMFVFAGCGGKEEKKEGDKKTEEKKDATSKIQGEDKQSDADKQAADQGKQEGKGKITVAKPPIDDNQDVEKPEAPMPTPEDKTAVPGLEEKPSLEVEPKAPAIPAPSIELPKSAPVEKPALEEKPAAPVEKPAVEEKPAPAPAPAADDPFGDEAAKPEVKEAPAAEAPKAEEAKKEDISELFGEEPAKK